MLAPILFFPSCKDTDFYSNNLPCSSLFFNQFSLSNCVFTGPSCSPWGGVDDVFLAGPVASVQVVVDELGFGVGTAQVFETDLLDVDGGYLFRVVTVYHEAEVGHVGEVGGAVDVVHLDAAQGAVLFVAVHLAGWATRMTRHWLRVAKRPSLFSVSVM